MNKANVVGGFILQTITRVETITYACTAENYKSRKEIQLKKLNLKSCFVLYIPTAAIDSKAPMAFTPFAGA